MNRDYNTVDAQEQAIVDFLNGRMSLTETEEFNSWIESAPENRRFFQAYQRLWLGTSAYTASDNFNAIRGWRRISSRMNHMTNRQKFLARQKTRKLYIRAARVAAMFFAVFAVGALASWLIFSNLHHQHGIQICEISVPQGSRSRIVLPDSSIVWLNAGSTISYDNDFSRSDRIVKLEGEAHFSVTTNPRKPFIVVTSHLNIKALGTDFNVRAYPDDDAILATLVEGNVIIEFEGDDNKVYTYPLEPRQNFSYIKADQTIFREEHFDEIDDEISESARELTVPPSVIDAKTLVYVKTNIRPELYTSWKDQEWIIEGESLDNMAVMLGRRYNTSIQLQSMELKEYKFSGTIMNETLEQVLEILRMTAPVKYYVGKGFVDWEIDPSLQDQFDKILDKKNNAE